ncbi:MAG: helix-turn-helix transcriptional regulator [Acidimicrobiales bacterium]
MTKNHKNQQVSEWLRINEAAAIAPCSPQTIRLWIKRGWLPAYRLGPRLIGIQRADLDAWLSRERLPREGHGVKGTGAVDDGGGGHDEVVSSPC